MMIAGQRQRGQGRVGQQGVVLLSGKTKSVATQLEAIQVADAVKGVHRVSSEVQRSISSRSATKAR